MPSHLLEHQSLFIARAASPRCQAALRRAGLRAERHLSHRASSGHVRVAVDALLRRQGRAAGGPVRRRLDSPQCPRRAGAMRPPATAARRFSTPFKSVVSTLARDRDLALLLMFEDRRMRGEEPHVRLSRGFVQFTETMRALVKRSQTMRVIDPALDPNAVTSALLGASEGMIRDRLLARGGAARGFAERDLRRTVERMLKGFSGTARPAARRRAAASRRSSRR